MRAKLPDKDGFVDRDGVKLHYEIYGDGAETMVFMPPWSIVHSRIYKAQVPYFSERFRCIAFDGRGNGKSDRPTDAAAYTLDNYVADALAVMDATDAGKAILVGLSFGGLLACVLAAHHPDRVKAAILAGTVASSGRLSYMTRAAFHGQAGTASRAGTSTTATTGSRTIPTSPSSSSATSAPSRTRPSRSRTASAGRARPPGRCWPGRWKRGAVPPKFDVSEAMYRKIRCPVLVIHGDDDQIQPYARAQAAWPSSPAPSS